MTTVRPALVALLAVALAGPAGVAAPGATAGPAGSQQPSDAAAIAATPDGNGSAVNVTVGGQLSTVIETTGNDVESDVEWAAVDAAFADGTERERAEALAERAAELRESAREVRTDYREATAAYEAGDISRSEYARRLAVLDARAGTLLASYDRLRDRAANVSGFELTAAGLNRTALAASARGVENLTGTGTAALLERFTARRGGEVALERDDGLTISVESDDDDRSRELERPRDGDDAMTVAQAAALGTARDALDDTAGNWTLSAATVHAESGYYRFAFRLRTADATGSAEVSVDGSTGEVFHLEEEIAPPEDDDDDEEVEDVALVVVEGAVEPGATVTVRALADGDPLAGATVLQDGTPVGRTDDDGTLAVALPDGSTTLTVATGGDDAELEFEFEREDDAAERRSTFAGIETTASLDGDTVTLTARYGGTAVTDLTVYAGDRRVGTTGANGTVTFRTNATEELELELVRGELEAELTYRVRNGSLVLVEDAREGDGDKVEREDDDGEETGTDDDSDDATETDDDTGETDDEEDD